MKARHAEWAKLTTEVKPRVVIRLLDLPGIRHLENERVMLNRLHSDAAEEAFELQCDEVSRQLFAVTGEETEFPFPIGYSDLEFSKQLDVTDKWKQHEARYAASNMPEHEGIAQLKRWGWDLNDEQGRPLLITPYFIRQIEAAVKGIAGQLPDMPAIRTDTWAENLEAEARRWERQKRKSPTD